MPNRILLIAEACNPSWASVPLVGYNMARALAERDDLDITLLTSVRNRDDLASDPIASQAEVVCIDTERIAGPMYRLGQRMRGGRSLGWTTAMAMAWPGYVAFERQVAKLFGPQLRAGDFDLIHRLTPLSPTLPSPIAGRFDVPFLLGPLNGGLPWPKEHPTLRSREREWLVPLRRLCRRLPYWKQTFRHADAVITASRHTATELPESFAGRHFHLPENGIDPERFTLADGWCRPKRPESWQFVTVGRLVPYKGVDIAIEAFAKAAAPEDRFVIIGDGPQRAELETVAVTHGVADRVEFRGWMPQVELAAVLRQSQAFLFPSLREFGGGVALEAMASGLPCLIADYGGPAELVTDACGIRVPMAGRDAMVASLAGAVRTLRESPETASSMGRTAVETVRREHIWTEKARRVVGFYEELLQTPAVVPTATRIAG